MTDTPPESSPSEDADGLEDVFEKECHLCGTEENLVPNREMPWLWTCRECLDRWEAHIEQIEERDEPPPSVE